jgi:hypothetical protein
MQHYSSQAFTDIAKPAGGAAIAVKIAGTNNNATIYSDDGITVKSNPFMADSIGHFDFYVASGKYDITISGTQITTVTLANQVIFDPFEVTTGDTTVVTNNNVPLNVADQGGFWGITITVPWSTQDSNIISFANQVYCQQFVLPYRVNIGKVTYQVTTTAAASIGDIGLYSATGNLVLNTGGFSTAVLGIATAPVVGGPVVLNAGVYLFAYTNSTNLVQMRQLTTSGASPLLNNQTVKKMGQAANAASGGVLPATLGNISAILVGPPITFFER